MSVQVGVKDLHVAMMTQEDTASTPAVYGALKKLAEVITIGFQPQSQNAVLYADDGAAETDSSNGPVTVNVNLKDIPLEMRSTLTGTTYISEKGGFVHKSNDTPPYLAMCFKSIKANGKYRYVILYKGKAVQPSENYQTKSETTNFNTPTIAFQFIRRIYDEADYAMFDEPEFTDGATFFDNVYEVTPDTTVPTVTISPADDATGVAVNSPITFTFSEAIQSDDVSSANFFVMEANTGNLVAGSLVYDSALFKVTFTPDSDLTATTSYIAVATSNVKDFSNNALAVNNVVNFTTT